MNLTLHSLRLILCLSLTSLWVSVSGQEIDRASHFISGDEPVFNQPGIADSEVLQEFIHQFAKADSLWLAGMPDEARGVYLWLLDFGNSPLHPGLKALLHTRLGFLCYWLPDIDASMQHYTHVLDLHRQYALTDTLLIYEALVFLDRYAKVLPSDGILLPQQEQSRILQWPGPGSDVRNIKYYYLKSILERNSYQRAAQWTALNHAERNVLESGHLPYYWLFLIRLGKGGYYYDIRNYQLAWGYFSDLEQTVNQDARLLYMRYSVISYSCEVNKRMGNEALAVEQARELFDELHRIRHPYFYYNYLTIAMTLEEQGKYDEALRLYKESLQLLQSIKARQRQLVVNYYFLARHFKLYRHDNGRKLFYLEKARTLLPGIDDPSLSSYIVYELGTHYYRAGDYARAIDIFDRELDDLDRLLESDSYFISRYPALVQSDYLRVLQQRARAQYYLSKQQGFDIPLLYASYSDFRNMLNIYQGFMERQWFEESQLENLEEIRDAYNALFNVGYEIYLQTRSDSMYSQLFSLAEESKSYLLRRYLNNEQAKQLAGIPEDQISRAKELKREVDTLMYNLSAFDENLSSHQQEHILGELEKRVAAHQDFEEELKGAYPAYREYLNRHQAPDAGLISTKLSDSRVLLEYQIVHHDLYILALTSDTMIIHYQHLDKPIGSEIMAFRNIFDNVNYANFDVAYAEQFAAASASLYEKLILPVRKTIAGKRLLIIPDGELSLIPFELLIDSDSIQQPYGHTYDKLPYLIRYNPVSYLYSAQQLLEPVEVAGRHIRYVGFAPDYAAMEENVVVIDSQQFILGPLPGALHEVQAGKKQFGGKIYTGRVVSKEKFFRSASKADIMHLAMHTLLDEVRPMNSRLIFSADLNNVSEQLHAYEVYSKDNKARLVVLSACNTGSGHLETGEGVFSISRAFLLADFDNVILTQWPVADQAGAAIIEQYYRYLQEGLPGDVALQRAKLDQLINGDPVKAHPYFWAAYMHTGNPIVITDKNSGLIRFLAGGGVLLLIMVFWFLWRKGVRTS